MAEWKADEKFLDYVLKKMEWEGEEPMDMPLIGSGGRTLSKRDFIEEMRNGTRVGKKMYESLYQRHQNDFEEYLVQQKQ